MKTTSGIPAVFLVAIGMVLAACGGQSTPSNPLAGTRWQLKDYASPSNPTGMTTALAAAIPTLEFDQDGALNGFGGCNSFNGNYTVLDEALTVGPLATTRMYCGEEGIMNQEQEFLAQLQGAAKFRIDGEQLHLLNGAGTLLALFNAS
jgi:heat shock protein HslJ